MAESAPLDRTIEASATAGPDPAPPRARRPLALFLMLLLLSGSVCLATGWLLTLDDSPPDLSPLVFREAPEGPSVHKQLIDDPPPVFLKPTGALLKEHESPTLTKRRRVSKAFEQQLIAPRRKAIAELVALANQSWRAPPEQLITDTPPSYISGAMAAGELLRYDAWCQARAGRPQRAWQNAEDAQRLGERLNRDSRSILEWVWSLSLLRESRRTFLDLLALLPIDEVPAITASRRLAQSLEGRHGLEEALKGDAVCIIRAIEEFDAGHFDKAMIGNQAEAWLRGSFGRRLFFKPNRSKRQVLDWFHEASSGLDRPVALIKPAQLAIYNPPLLNRITDTNHVGTGFIRDLLTPDHQLKRLRLHDIAHTRMTAIALRIALFEKREGRRPDSLKDLELGDLPRDILDDPFAPGPLRWVPGQRRLESRGDDAVKLPERRGVETVPEPGD